MPTSQNGWPVYTSSSSLTDFGWVTGRVRGGDVLTIFDHLCRRFSSEVEPIIRAHSWGYAYRAVRGQMSGFSNHASATAIDLNAPAHPLGVRDTFSGVQVTAIRRILADLDGVVRWGGDYSGRPDEMHFEINANAATVAAVAARLNEPEDPMANYAEQLDRIERQNDAILKRLGAQAAIRTRLARLVEQGKATRKDLADLQRDFDAMASDGKS